jgi:U4/U6 small nuclear ribonucleoprotein PRP31
MEYTYAVATIGNGPLERIKELTSSTDNIIGQSLDKLIMRHKLITVITEATITKGQDLVDLEAVAVRTACQTMLNLERGRKTLNEFVESRMNRFAPNLTRLLGSSTAAQLLNARGGLTNLANTRASNIPSIGSKRGVAGLATNIGVRSQSQGYLHDSELVRGFRPELRTQAMRIVSAKIVLAARVDRVHESPDGSVGEDLLEQCQKRLDKLTEPAPNRGQKALPAPEDKPSKKRGGRRARKAKEATAMTDIRKAQNRMAFGKEEQEVGYGTGEGTVGLGMIGQNNDGRVRALQIDQRTRAKLSKKNTGWGGATPAPGAGGGNGLQSSLRGFGQGGGAGNATVLKGHGLRTSGVATSLGGAAGTASSLNFGVKSGLELVDPKVRASLDRKNQADQDRWFKGGTFTQVGGGSSVVPKPPVPTGGFAVPALPVKRKAADP